MALIKCYECGRQVSSDAVKCPHCGASHKGVKRMQWIYIAVILLAFAAFVLFNL